MTKIKITKEQLQTRPIPAPPKPPIDITYAQFVEEHLLPMLPAPERVADFHRRLLAYLDEPDPLYAVRYVKGQTRGTIVTTGDGARLLPTDNSPAWWLHAALFNDVDLAAEDFAEFIGAMPYHFHQMGGYPTINQAGWHAAHIVNAKDGNTDWRAWSRREAARRFVCNLHPLNLFYVPKTEWHRVGGLPELIGYVADAYCRRYPRIWNEFTHIAGRPDYRPDAATTRLQIDDAPKPKVRGAKTIKKAAKRPRRDRSGWDYILSAPKSAPIARFLAEHPLAEKRARALVKDLTVERFVALGDTILNKVRLRTQLEKEAPNDRAAQRDIAWQRIEKGINKIYTKPSGWTRTIAHLQNGAEPALARICEMDSVGVMTAALRVTFGPYSVLVRRA